MNKTGTLETKEIIELILAAAGIFLLVVLLYQLIAPDFDKDKETAKAYLESFEEEISKADGGGKGEFMIWENDRFFIVYFGNDRTYALEWPGDNNHYFVSEPGHKYNLCICYDLKTLEIKEINSKEYKKTNCDYCVELKYPAYLYGSDYWVKGIGAKLSIEKEDNKYIFTQVK